MTEKKVLIVDFDDKSINPLSKFLEEEGFSVKVARDGEEGLESAKADQPDLVILEPMLPKLHGFELCGIITHDFEPKIPVIILTKFYREEQFKIESVRSFGASAFVSKPFEPEKMRDILTEVLPNGGGASGASGEAADDDIPDTIPADTLKDLQEAAPEKPGAASDKPEVEEAKLPEPDPLEKDLLKSVIVDEPKKPEGKKERDFAQELDAMLQDTLAGFNLGEEKQEAAPQSSAQEVQAPVPEEQDDILQKLDEIARSSAGKPQSEAPRAADIAFEAPQQVVQKAEEVTSTLEKELESKVREFSGQEPEPEKAEPKAEPTGKQEPEPEPAPEVQPEPEAGFELEVKLDAESAREPEDELKADAVPDPEVKPEPVQKAKPESDPEPDPEINTEQDEKPEVKEEKPDLQEVVEQEDMFAGFGTDDDVQSGPSVFTSLIEKVKNAPVKYLVPLAAVFLVVIVSALIIFGPRKPGDTPENQASLGVTTIGQTRPGTPPETESTKPASDPAEDPSNPAGLGEEDPEGTGTQPRQDDPARQPESKPAQKPAQKSQTRVTPPPSAPVLPEGMEQGEEEAEAPPENQPESKPAGDPTEQPAVKPESKRAQENPSGEIENPPVKASDPPAKSADPAVKPASPPEESADPPAESEQSPPPAKVQPQKASLGDIVAIQQVDRQPEIISQELPRFPAAAKGRGITGTVLINALISENGDVLQTVVLRKINSPYNFNEEAERAVKLWKFRPAWKDGVRVKTWKVIPISFKENMD